MNLKQALQYTLTEEELGLLVRSYDVVGDIAIIVIPEALLHRAVAIGNALLQLNKRIKVVARRAGTYDGEYRILPLEVIAGEQRFTTVHREFGVSLTLDLQYSYFSTRSGNERKRIADQITGPESVLVMFSGVGPYPLLIGRHSCAQSVVGIEKNPVAHSFALLNLKQNRLGTRVRLIGGDVTEVVPDLGCFFDRVIMPLPATACTFLDLALSCLNPGGHLHFYDFRAPDQFELTAQAIDQAAMRAGRSVYHDGIVVCGHNSPTTYRICADATID